MAIFHDIFLIWHDIYMIFLHNVCLFVGITKPRQILFYQMNLRQMKFCQNGVPQMKFRQMKFRQINLCKMKFYKKKSFWQKYQGPQAHRQTSDLMAAILNHSIKNRLKKVTYIPI